VVTPAPPGPQEVQGLQDGIDQALAVNARLAATMREYLNRDGRGGLSATAAEAAQRLEQGKQEIGQ